MDVVLNWLWQGGVVAATTTVALLVLRRARAAHRYALCSLALMGVLALPVLPAIVPLPPPAGEAPQFQAALPLVAVPPGWWTSTAVVIVFWALWSLAAGARLAAGLMAARRLERRCIPFPTAVESRLVCWRAVQPHGRQARLVLSHGIRSAGVLGHGTPVIAVAPVLLERLADEELDRVVIHEWAHVQRRDDILNLAHLAARAIAGWHPAVWWLTRQLQIEREAACDEIAVSLTGCPKTYAASLTTLAALLPARRVELPAPAALSSSGLGARVVRILSQRRLAPPAWSRSAAATAVLVLCALASVLPAFQLVARAAVTAEQTESVPDVALQPGDRSSAPGRPTAEAATPRPPTEARPSALLPARPDGARPRADVRQAPPESMIAPPAPAASAFVVPDQPVEPLPVWSGTSAPGSRLPDEPLRAPTAFAATPEPFGQPAPPARPPSAWRAVADAGVSVGRGSQQAAAATAGLFTRFGRKVAASF